MIRRRLFLAIVLALSLCGRIAVANDAPVSETASDNQTEQSGDRKFIDSAQLANIVKTLNVRCPIRVGSNLTMVAATSPTPSTLAFRYQTQDELAESAPEELLTPLMSSEPCKKESVRLFLDSGIAIEYEIVDPNGRRVAHSRLEPGQCDRPEKVVSLNDRLKAIVDYGNAIGPRKINDKITITSLTRSDEPAITYHYRATRLTADERQRLEASLTPAMTAMACLTPNTRSLLDEGVRFRYLVVDENSRPLFRGEVTVDQCDEVGQDKAWLKTFIVEGIKQGQKKLPVKITETDSIIEISAPNESTIAYTYQTTDARTIVEFQKVKNRASILDHIASKTCSTNPLSLFLKAGGTIRYRIVDGDRRLLTQGTVTPNQCGF